MSNLIKGSLFIMVCLSFAEIAFADLTSDRIRSEANYILSCQYMVTEADPVYGNGYGAINDVRGFPTWVVPRENSMAILGLILAAQHLNDSTYLERAQLAADYLVRIQDTDGAWYNQYGYATPGDINHPEDTEPKAKSPTQTAEVMIALYKLGYVESRYTAMKKGAQYLMECQNVANKDGNDDGLICGGKEITGNYRDLRWTSDNSYGYQALKAAQGWALIQGDETFAQTCALAAQRVIDGIDNYLYHAPIWYVAIDGSGNTRVNPDPAQYGSLPNWISYAPQMLDLPANGVNAQAIGEWINNTFQQPDGSCLGYDYDDKEAQPSRRLKTRKYPGLSFQAALAWYDLGQNTFAESAKNWAYNSGLNHPDGGWIDWVEVSPDAGTPAVNWKRFIDTSFYAIATLKGGYSFNTYMDYTLNLVINGTGTGSANCASPPLSCSTGCTTTYYDVTPMTLTATPFEYTLPGVWAGCDTVTGSDCALIMDRNRSVTVTFDKDTVHVARINVFPPVYYPTIAEAYTAALQGDTIQAWGIDFPETLSCATDKQIHIEGGYDQQYLNKSGVSSLHGLSIGYGTATVENLVIR
jgi:hypothetical protein